MIKIYNNTDLSYKTIGQVIDHYRNSAKEDTLYNGKTDKVLFEYKSKGYEAQIKYGERGVSWSFFNIDDIKYME